jgi:hypothetical protein
MQFLTDKNTDFREFDISESIIKITTDKPYTIVYWEKGNKVDGTWIKSSLLNNSGEELGSIVFADDNLNISDIELLKQDLFEKHNSEIAPFFNEENFICFSAVFDMAGRFFSVCVWNHRTSAHAYCRYATG